MHAHSLFAHWGLGHRQLRQIKNYQKKIGSKSCHWSDLNAPGTQTPLSLSVLELEICPFLTISPLE